jgi:hypothetical protein
MLNGGYTVLRDDGFMGGGMQITGELMADKVNGVALTGDYLNIFNFNSIGLPTIITNYTKPYTVIQRANNTLENLALVTSSDASKNNVEGQARFLRGLSYFEMIKLFAQPWGYTPDNSHLGLVLKTKSDFEAALPRSSVATIYDLILEDLTKASTLLPATNGNYPTSWSAKAMLARIYFQMNEFDSAYKYSDLVINSGLFPFDFSSAFITNRFSNPKSPEAIFWIVNETNLPAAFTRLRNTSNIEQSMGLTITQAAFENATANTNDLRAAWYKDSLTATGAHIYSVNKYKHPSFILPVIHVTEMKLIRAESLAELGTNLSTAISDINDITNRAYAGMLAPLPGAATAATIKDRVRTERNFEMVFESGDRIQQIKRIGAKGEVSFSRTAPWNCLGMALQFPATETNVNSNFIQNPIGPCL